MQTRFRDINYIGGKGNFTGSNILLAWLELVEGLGPMGDEEAEADLLGCFSLWLVKSYVTF